MSIRIQHESCTGCGKCRQVCPGNLLAANAEGKTVIRRPKDCWGCTSCVKECQYQAIAYYLGADMGGRGYRLHTRQEAGKIHWVIIDPAGGERVITVDRNQANAY